MVNSLSKRSFFLLWVEEMSQTIRGVEMACVVQITLQDTWVQDDDDDHFFLISTKIAHLSRLSHESNAENAGLFL